MNIYDYKILKEISKAHYNNQRELAKKCGFSVGKINKTISILIDNNYVDKSLHLTKKAQNLLNENKPTSAVILAAGYGLRMIPINNELPKGLVVVKGETLIERIINQLHDVNIKKIYIVVGHMKERYDFLIDKYGVKLIVNSNYGIKNNLYSLKLLIDKVNNTYIVPCDIWCKHNPFDNIELYSWYMVSNELTIDSPVKVNRNSDLILIKNGEWGNREIGIAYINGQTSELLRKKVKKLCLNEDNSIKFWEYALEEKGRYITHANFIDSNEVFEINTFEDLRNYDKKSPSLASKLIDLISNVLNVSSDKICEIHSLKKGMTNRSFIFSCEGTKYIFRVPGEGTDLIINRKNEYSVYQVINNKNICDDLIYINSDTGYKITKYIENSSCCDPNNFNDVTRCITKLRKIHRMKLKVNHSFDIFENIEYYEKLRNCESVYSDYDKTKQKIYELKRYVDNQEKNFVLCHIDSVPDNFLFNGNDVTLIDWEYAGMQDPHVDIAMFAIYSFYDKEKIDKLIDIYFDNNCEKSIRLKIYCYVAICGFLWSNWCEYKRSLGVEFGEYSMNQYRYAKDFYNIFKEESD